MGLHGLSSNLMTLLSDFCEHPHASNLSNWKRGIKMHILRNFCGKKKKKQNISYLFIRLARQ